MIKMIQWVLAATLVCGATAFMTGCKKATVQETTVQETTVQEDSTAQAVTSEELIRTSQSWDGVELPDYFQGRPELVAMKYVFPAGQKLGWHHHPVMNYGILVQDGENRGTKPVILYMFYLSQKDLPLAVQHPEIPLE